MSPDLLTTSFLHDGDAFTLELRPDGNDLLLVSILRYLQNENVAPTGEAFFSLDRDTKEAILRAVRRKWDKKNLRIQ